MVSWSELPLVTLARWWNGTLLLVSMLLLLFTVEFLQLRTDAYSAILLGKRVGGAQLLVSSAITMS